MKIFIYKGNYLLLLHQIVDVDEKNQILTTNCWLTQVGRNGRRVTSGFPGVERHPPDMELLGLR